MSHDMQRLPSRNNNARLLASIQCATLQILLGSTDTTNRQAAFADERADNCAATCGAGRCGGVRPCGPGNQAASESEVYGGAAGGCESAGVKV